MKWVIKHIHSGMYAVSPRFFVYNKRFSRRFNSKNQAETYMTSSGFDRKKFTTEVLHEETMETEGDTFNSI
ncbi:MAG: hypothetical protein K6G33_01380 [Ruminococcus sp.]|uniref:hypothetical protein n=1 Tax=Ruminococcus sp. TaxID=41978 RepID=UPI0015683195|nr:hypothetical protein [Ruminococcus sp.]MCR5599384.1 hypothetical protein [Ruminococcus sp.]